MSVIIVWGVDTKMPVINCKIHPTAQIWHPNLSNLYGCEIGEHCNIAASVGIGSGVLIGKRCRIGSFVFIPPGVTIQDDVFIGPGTTFTNDKHPPSDGKYWRETLVESGVSIGAGCTICPGVTLHRGCSIGAGSVVTKDVPEGVLVYGNPARERKIG